MPTPADPGDPRLAELLRQRELVARHLAWLDSEIFGTGAGPAQTITPAPAQSIRPVAPSTPRAPEPALTADSILAQAPTGISPRDKWGCIAIVFVLGLLVLGALLLLPYLLPKYR